MLTPFASSCTFRPICEVSVSLFVSMILSTQPALAADPFALTDATAIQVDGTGDVMPLDVGNPGAKLADSRDDSGGDDDDDDDVGDDDDDDDTDADDDGDKGGDTNLSCSTGGRPLPTVLASLGAIGLLAVRRRK